MNEDKFINNLIYNYKIKGMALIRKGYSECADEKCKEQVRTLYLKQIESLKYLKLHNWEKDVKRFEKILNKEMSK